MLRMSALGELEGVGPAHQSRPQTRESQFQYVWKPSQGGFGGMREANGHESYQAYGYVWEVIFV